MPATPRTALVALLVASCHGHATHAPPPSPPPPGASAAAVADAAVAPPPEAAAERHHRACSPKLVALALAGDVAAVRDLIVYEDCTGDAADSFGTTALMHASEAGHLEVVKVLVKAGVRVDQPLNQGGSRQIGRTALWYAVEADRADVVAVLLGAGADPNPLHGMPLLVVAAKHESAAVAKLLVAAGASTTAATDGGDTAMTFDGGPSAAVFVYLESIGMSADGLPADVRESLRREASRAPTAAASAEEHARYYADVVTRTKSRRSRQAAVKHLGKLTDQGAIAVPALLGVVLGASLDDYDWSPTMSATALQRFTWTPELGKALPRLLAMIAKDERQQMRIELSDLVGTLAPVTAATVTAFTTKLQRGPDRMWGALALGKLLPRAAPSDAALVRRARKALEAAARLTTKSDCSNEAECERVEAARSAREVLATLPP